MNEILKFLNSHVSVRQFTDQPVTESDELAIVTTAQRSPTSSNIQAYSIITIRNRTSKDRLAELCGGQNHVSESALFLVFCADLFRLKSLNDSRDYPFDGGFSELFIQATVDAALVAGRALQAAQALGLGGVMVGGIRDRIAEVSELLNLPELVYPVMGMSLGFPVKPSPIKPRLPIEAIAFRESYQTGAFEQSISEYDDTITHLGYLKGREVRPENYPDFDGVYSWSEHTARRMADVDGPTMRAHMLEYLRNRGLLTK